MIDETFYLSRDNKVDLEARVDGATIDGAVVTRTQLSLTNDSGAATIIDSNTKPDVFDWSVGGGVLRLDLGAEGLAKGDYTARLFIFDASNPAGLVWGDPFRLVAADAG